MKKRELQQQINTLVSVADQTNARILSLESKLTGMNAKMLILESIVAELQNRPPIVINSPGQPQFVPYHTTSTPPPIDPYKVTCGSAGNQSNAPGIKGIHRAYNDIMGNPTKKMGE